jgi:hypothetical protein
VSLKEQEDIHGDNDVMLLFFKLLLQLVFFVWHQIRTLVLCQLVGAETNEVVN